VIRYCEYSERKVILASGREPWPPLSNKLRGVLRLTRAKKGSSGRGEDISKPRWFAS